MCLGEFILNTPKLWNPSWHYLAQRSWEQRFFTFQEHPLSHRTTPPLQRRQQRRIWWGNPGASCHQWASWHRTGPRGQDTEHGACSATHAPWRRWRWWQTPFYCPGHSFLLSFHCLEQEKQITAKVTSMNRIRATYSLLSANHGCTLKAQYKLGLHNHCSVQSRSNYPILGIVQGWRP